ncbi:MAG: Multicopper oxidase, partial [Candidatus Binatus sp.]|nr:Multicopper oxidase [Candidatus Binatus sp.]
MKSRRPLLTSLFFIGLYMTAISLLFTATDASAQGSPCVRYAQGNTIVEPENLFSVNGVLTVALSYQTGVDQFGNTQFCYVLPDGNQSPTLHINPGDRLVLTLTNDTPAPSVASAMQMAVSDPCGAATMTASSTNVHYHGTNVSPACHQDEVIHTLINSGELFTYDIQFPTDEPSGLYWYHPHAHGLSEMAVQGGASGAIVVDGIENLQPKVAGLTERMLIVRDNPLPPDLAENENAPAWDLSLNYVPVPFPDYPTAVIPMAPHERQFWRVLNASADTILDLELLYDKTSQTLQLVALDGVPVGSQDGTRQGKIQRVKHFVLAPAGRAEFIVRGPGSKIKNAVLRTRKVNTGPDGDSDPTRPIARINTNQVASASATSNRARTPAGVLTKIPSVSGPANRQRFEGLAGVKPDTKRVLFFSEQPVDPNDPNSDTEFFITVDGQTPTVFSPDNPPAIVTTQGTTEDWIIQNRSLEQHDFHIHQIHFLLLERDGHPVPPSARQFRDMIPIPFWKGKGPYPCVKERMDFRGPDVGDFVYH